MTTLPRCPFRGCPIRWPDDGGSDRYCAEHTDHDTLTARLAEMGALPAAQDGALDGAHPDGPTAQDGRNGTRWPPIRDRR